MCRSGLLCTIAGPYYIPRTARDYKNTVVTKYTLHLLPHQKVDLSILFIWEEQVKNKSREKEKRGFKSFISILPVSRLHVIS